MQHKGFVLNSKVFKNIGKIWMKIAVMKVNVIDCAHIPWAIFFNDGVD